VQISNWPHSKSKWVISVSHFTLLLTYTTLIFLSYHAHNNPDVLIDVHPYRCVDKPKSMTSLVHYRYIEHSTIKTHLLVITTITKQQQQTGFLQPLHINQLLLSMQSSSENYHFLCRYYLSTFRLSSTELLKDMLLT